MKKVIIYLFALLALIVGSGWLLLSSETLSGNPQIKLAVSCTIFGGLGGITYCLRGIYLNACVHGNWDPAWIPWYFLRPVVSSICGLVSFLFLKIGLLVLEANQFDTTANLGFLALAFVAGLNVDKFLDRIGDVAESTWGIKKNRASTKKDD